MAIDLFTLLTLPVTSDGFSKAKNNPVHSDGSASPARKIPRLEGDSDSASASRSSVVRTSAQNIQIHGQLQRPSVDSQSDFQVVRQSIKAALTRPSTGLSFSYESIFNSCRATVCVFDDGEKLYNVYKAEMESTIRRTASELLSTAKHDMEWISLFVDMCQWFERQVALLKSLLAYLNQVYVATNSHLLDVQDLAYSMFLRGIFESHGINERLQNGIKAWLQYERNMWMPHDQRRHIGELTRHLTVHEQYGAFEDFYVTQTREFCIEESLKMANSLREDAPAFFKHVDRRIEDEISRSRAVLFPGSWNLIRETTENALMAGRLEWLATQTLKSYIQTKNIEMLTKIYQLYDRVGGKKVLCAAFRTYVEERVKTIVKDPATDEDMVKNLLDFKATIDQTISTAFLDDPSPHNSASSSTLQARKPNLDFIYAETDAFTYGFKARRNKPAEMMAKYLDKVMRKGQGAASDDTFNKQLDAVLGLYRFTDDKDVFRTFYHRQLAKRLLLEKSASYDFEKTMLQKLKTDYDPDFGLALDMFKDLSLSREMIADYHAHLPPGSEGHKLTAMVLQQSAWPFTVQKSTIDLPLKMRDELTNFEKVYKEKHQGRVLDWDYALGTVTMIARFRPGRKELSVSLYQAVILLLFNDQEEWLFTDIAARTRLEDGELRRTLQSLACGKKKVLKKVPAGRDVNDTDVFRFNLDFDDPRAKVHINSIQAKVSPEESKRTQENIDTDRKHSLDAAIVRIMKGSKTMALEQLVIATVDAVKNHFKPKGEDVRKRILAMVEQEYLERDSENMNVFHYLA